jgi:hypothetical protein
VTLARTLRTARRIPPRQLAHRLRFLWLRRNYADAPTLPFARAAVESAGMAAVSDLPRLPDDVLWPEGVAALERRAEDLARGRFVHLNRVADFGSGVRWRDDGASRLWLYQLQYLSCVADLARTGRVAAAARIVASWRAEHEGRWDAVAWHPYPTSLRLVNLCVAATCAGGFQALGDGVEALVAAHAAYLLRHVERDVRGNHLLENARALLWAGRVFRGGVAGDCGRVARSLLETEIAEQVLPDGGHFEMSPMYHCIVMRDLIEVHALLGGGDPLVRRHVIPALRRMGEFLAGVLCPDGDIPLLGDSARGFAPPAHALLRLVGVARDDRPGVRSFPDSGLHVLRSRRVWAIFDAGPVCPTYLPAHGQADSLTIEAWVDGVRVVADPGVHDYAGPERSWGRSSRAHSTVTFGDRDTSEVYGGFRVGGRARVTSVGLAEKGDEVVATIRPHGSRGKLSRSVRVYGESLTIEDWGVGSSAETVRSRLHLDPGAGFVVVEDARRGGATGAASRIADVDAGGAVVRVEEGRVAPEFGRSLPSTLLVQEARADGARMRWVIGPA